MKKVLVVDDEPSIVTLLTFNWKKKATKLLVQMTDKSVLNLLLSNHLILLFWTLCSLPLTG